jgi:hypothetical protein
MKSKLFSTIEFSKESKERLKEDISIVFSLPIEVILIGFEFLPRFIEADKPEEYSLIFDELSRKGNINKNNSTHLLSILYFFAQYLISDDYSGDEKNWFDDLVELNLLSVSDDAKLKAILDSFSHEQKTLLKEAERKELYRKGVLPYFCGCNITIEDRYVLDKDYSYGLDIKQYDPKVLCKIPIVSIHFLTDANNNNDFFFQASVEDVKFIINKLYSALVITNSNK